MDNRVRTAINRTLAKFKPPKKQTLSEWAESTVVLPAEAGGIPGPYRTSVTPFHKEILDCVTDKRYERVSWVSGSQLGKTTLLLIASHYFIEEDPSPILFLEPNESLSKDLSDQRFRGYIRDNKGLKTLLSDQESKSNISEKIYPGGYLKFGSAQTLTDLISRPIRLLVMDEVSSYPFNLKDKGNPISLAIARTASSFRYSRKILTCSTPGLEGLCNITEAYGKSDQRTYQVPCPFCSEYLEFELSGLTWKPDSEGVGAYYTCPHCKGEIQDNHKQWMLAHGYWKKNKPEVLNHAGFRLNGIYSPFVTFEDIAIRYRAAKEKASKMYNDYADLTEFYNQTLALTWNDQHLSNVGKHDLIARKEHYAAEVPAAVGLLLAGIDMQGDRAEITVIGYGKNDQIYIINHFSIYGSPYIDPDLDNATLYQQLDSLLNRPFKHESGRDMYIKEAFIDSGDGNSYGPVLKFALARTGRGLYAIKGSRVVTDPIFDNNRFKDKKTGKYAGYLIGVNTAKTEIFNRLKISLNDSGRYIHFPDYTNFNDQYFGQLTSEMIKNEKNAKGIVEQRWKKKHDSIRNEALDCLVYAIAAKYRFISVQDPNIINLLVDDWNKEPDSPEQEDSEPGLELPTPAPRPVQDPSIALSPQARTQPTTPRFRIPQRFNR